jgi:phosphoribosylformylglycinamidine synthase
MGFARKIGPPRGLALSGADGLGMVGAMKVTVTVMPKTTVLDPQGAATAEAVKHLGLTSVRQVRIGRQIEFETDDVPEAKLHEIARDLLSNPVMEDYTLTIS